MLVYATSVFAQGRPTLDIIAGDELIQIVDTDLQAGNELEVWLHLGAQVLANEQVKFEVVTGGGYFYTPGLAPADPPEVARTLLTDANGRIKISNDANAVTHPWQTSYHFGTVSGNWEETFLNNVIQVTHTTGGPNAARTVTFRLGAVPDAPDTVEIVSGNNQSGSILTILPEPLTVIVKDGFGNPYSSDVGIVPVGTEQAPRATVTFTAVDLTGLGAAGFGLPTAANLDVIADYNGRASVTFRLGDKEGNYQARADLIDPAAPPAVVDTVNFAAVAELPFFIPNRLDYVSGNGVIDGVPGEPLTEGDLTGIYGAGNEVPFVVQVMDTVSQAAAVPVPGWEVTFTVTKGDGTLPGEATSIKVTTDDNGRASTLLTLGMYPTTYADPNHGVAEEWRNEVVAVMERLNVDGNPDGQVSEVFTAFAIPPTALTVDPAGNANRQAGTVQTQLANALVTHVTGVDPATGNPTNRNKVKVRFDVLQPTKVDIDNINIERATYRANDAAKYTQAPYPGLAAGGVAGAISLEVKTNVPGNAAVNLTLAGVSGISNHVIQVSADVWDANLRSWKEATGIFIATANPAVPAFVEKIPIDVVSPDPSQPPPDIFLGDKQEEVVASTLPDQLSVVLKDRYGNVTSVDPVTGNAHTVRFAVTSPVPLPDETGLLVDPGNPVNTADINVTAIGQASVPFRLGIAATNKSTNATYYKVGVSVLNPAGGTYDTLANWNPVTNPNKKDNVFVAVALPGPGAIIVEIAGDDQSAAVKSTLANPLRVRVLDKYENSVPNWVVIFEVVDPDLAGIVAGVSGLGANKSLVAEVSTNANGFAQTTLTLGKTPGVDINRWDADLGLDPAGNLVPVAPPRSPFAGWAYDLTEPIDGTLIDPATGLPDPAAIGPNPGKNKINAKIYTGQSETPIYLDSDDDDPIDLMFTATGLIPLALNKIPGGDNQHGIVNADEDYKSILQNQLAVQVMDTDMGVPVSGQNVTWIVESGSGVIRAALANPDATQVTSLSNANGQSSVWLIIGTGAPDTIKVRATVTTLDPQGNPVGDATVRFTAFAEKGMPGIFNDPVTAPPGGITNPVDVVIAFPDDWNVPPSAQYPIGVVGKDLPVPLTAQVHDRYNNLMIGVPVDFDEFAGGGEIVAVTPDAIQTDPHHLIAPTDRQGNATLTYTLGTKSIEEPEDPIVTPRQPNNKVRATVVGDTYDNVTGVAVSGTFNQEFWAIAVHDEPDSIGYVNGNYLRGKVRTALMKNFKAIVKDKHGNPVVYTSATVTNPVPAARIVVKYEVSYPSWNDIDDWDEEAGSIEEFAGENSAVVSWNGGAVKPNTQLNAIRTIELSPISEGTTAVVMELGAYAWTHPVGGNPTDNTIRTDKVKASVNGYALETTFEATADPGEPANVAVTPTDLKMIADGQGTTVVRVVVTDSPNIEKNKPVDTAKRIRNPVPGLVVEMPALAAGVPGVIAGNELGSIEPFADPTNPTLPNGNYQAIYTAGLFEDGQIIADRVIVNAQTKKSDGTVVAGAGIIILTDVIIELNVDKEQLVADGDDETGIAVTV